MPRELLLGIDGGGSKTAGVLLDGEGRLLARGRAGPSSVLGDPSPASCAVLSALVDSLCATARQTRDAILHCGIGLNGIDFADELPAQLAGISQAIGLPPEHVTLTNDGIPALWGASPARASLIVQHGSGFTAAYRRNYGREELFDHLSVASIFDMRYALIPLVARMINGMAPATPLKDAALAAYGVGEERYCEAIYRGQIPDERLRGTVPLIFTAWQRGDEAAAALVQSAIADYALAARAMIQRTGSDRPAVALGGGQLQSAPEEFWRLLTARIHEHYPWISASAPLLPPEFGAALMAAFHAGGDPAVLFARLVATE